MAPRPERLTSSGPLPVLSNSLAAPYAKHLMGIHVWPSLSRDRDAVYYTPQCERLEQRNFNSFMSLASLPQAAPLALVYPPGAREHSCWSTSHGRAHSRQYSTHCGPYDQERSRVASLMTPFSSSTRPMHSSGCRFRKREPAEPHGAILSGANSKGMSASTMAQSLMSLRGTCLLGEIAADLRRELFPSLRFPQSNLMNSTGFGSNTHFHCPLPAHQSEFYFPNFFESLNTRLPDGQAADVSSKREVGSPRDPRLMQQVDHTILMHHLLVTPSLSTNYSLDVTSISICSGVV